MFKWFKHLKGLYLSPIRYTLSSRVRAPCSLVQTAADPRDVTGAGRGPGGVRVKFSGTDC